MGSIRTSASHPVRDASAEWQTARQRPNRKRPNYEPLRLVLDGLPRRASPLLTTGSDEPWGKVHFQHQGRNATLAAGLDGLLFHDIRGTACTLQANSSCTPSEIASYLGWTVTTVNELLDRYQAMTAAQSDSAVAKLEAKQ